MLTIALFFEGGEKVFPEFFTRILGDYNVLDKKFHIAGVSNGGISAFHIAAMYPQYFWSVTGLPGFLPQSAPERVRAALVRAALVRAALARAA